LIKKIAQVYKQKREQYDQLIKEEKLLENQTLKINSWQERPELFREVLREKMSVKWYHKSESYNNLQMASEAKQSLEDLSNKYGLSIGSMSKENRESFANDMNSIMIITDEKQNLEKTVDIYQKLISKLDEFTKTEEYTDAIKTVAIFKQKNAVYKAIIDGYTKDIQSLSDEKKTIEGKIIPIGKGKKIAGIDDKIKMITESLQLAQNNLKANASKFASYMDTNVSQLLVRIVKTEFGINNIDDVSVEEYIRRTSYNYDVDQMISKLKVSLDENKNKTMQEIEYKTKEVSVLCEKNNIDFALIHNITRDDINNILNNKGLTLSEEQLKQIEYYNTLKNEKTNDGEFKAKFDELVPEIIEETEKVK
jgi:hypothetical protein